MLLRVTVTLYLVRAKYNFKSNSGRHSCEISRMVQVTVYGTTYIMSMHVSVIIIHLSLYYIYNPGYPLPLAVWNRLGSTSNRNLRPIDYCIIEKYRWPPHVVEVVVSSEHSLESKKFTRSSHTQSSCLEIAKVEHNAEVVSTRRKMKCRREA